jgi:hypothetical protein
VKARTSEFIEVAAALHERKTLREQPVPKHKTFDTWLIMFKSSCGEYNSQLTVDQSGASLIDFMEDEPLRRAFHDGVAPEIVAKEFAAQFDITKFSR